MSNYIKDQISQEFKTIDGKDQIKFINLSIGEKKSIK